MTIDKKNRVYLTDTTFVSEDKPSEVWRDVYSRNYRIFYPNDLTPEYAEDALRLKSDGFVSFGPEPGVYEGCQDEHDLGEHLVQKWGYEGDLGYRPPFRTTITKSAPCKLGGKPPVEKLLELDEDAKTFSGFPIHPHEAYHTFRDDFFNSVSREKAFFASAGYSQMTMRSERMEARNAWIANYGNDVDGFSFFEGIEDGADFEEALLRAFRVRLLDYFPHSSPEMWDPTLSKSWSIKDGAPCANSHLLGRFGGWDRFVERAGFGTSVNKVPHYPPRKPYKKAPHRATEWLSLDRWYYDEMDVEAELIDERQDILRTERFTPEGIADKLDKAERPDLAERVRKEAKEQEKAEKKSKAAEQWAANPTDENIVKLAEYLKHKNT